MVVLDAPLLLALINKEDGAEKVQLVLRDSIISTAHYAEIAAVLSRIGMQRKEKAILKRFQFLFNFI